MSFAKHQRVRVTRPGSDMNKVGSITALYPPEAPETADVVLDDGSDQQSGGKLPPAPAKNFTVAELSPN